MAENHGPHRSAASTHVVPQAYPRHHLPEPYPLQRHIGPCQYPQHIFTAEPETPALVGPCTAHGGWPLAKRHPLWTTHQWREALRFKDACKHDMKACDINPKGWEAVAEDRTAWRQATHRGIERADEKKHQDAAEKRMR